MEINDYWNALENGEEFANSKIDEQLNNWKWVIENTFLLALSSPYLEFEERTTATKIAALFLKRSLTDYRALYNLILSGYPYQAGAVAASLYENSKCVTCFSESEQRSQEFLQSGKSDMPWKVVEMAKMCSQYDLYGKIQKPYPSDQDFILAWKLDYDRYKHLCKMKHPTMQQVIDEASHATVGEKFGVIVLPDSREEQIGLKEYIIVGAMTDLKSAARNFVSSQKPKESLAYERWMEILTLVHKGLLKLISTSSISKMPIRSSVR